MEFRRLHGVCIKGIIEYLHMSSQFSFILILKNIEVVSVRFYLEEKFTNF